MADWRVLAVRTGGAAAGLAAGYLLERASIRPHARTLEAEPRLGRLEGEESYLEGPDGVRLAVETYGPAADPGAAEVVLAHGFCLTGRVWHEQVAALSRRLRVVTYDHPGHGRSSPPRTQSYSLDLLADALATVVADATDPRRGRCLLVGHSMGAMTILAYARRHPEAFADRVGALLLLSTTASAGAEDVALGYGIRTLLRFERGVGAAAGLLGRRARRIARLYPASTDLSFAVTRAVGLGRDADPRHVDFTEQLVVATDLDTVARLTPALLHVDEEDTLKAVDIPTVVVVGGADRLTPQAHAHRMAAVNPDVEVVELPGVGHMTPLEAAPAVNALVARLADVAADAGRG